MEKLFENRKFSFCPSLVDYSLDNLIVECPNCARFFGACCEHKALGGDLYDPDKDTCHFMQLVFTDGACANNGMANAKAGLGFTIGTEEQHCWSFPVDDAVDPGAPRTNQRAELLAAIEGLKTLHQMNVTHDGRRHRKSAKHHRDQGKIYVVFTDSEYVVKGITEWFFSWRQRGWRTSAGKEPVNLDLFLTLDEYVTGLENGGVDVGFFHIPRLYNHLADSLAKRATQV